MSEHNEPNDFEDENEEIYDHILPLPGLIRLLLDLQEETPGDRVYAFLHPMDMDYTDALEEFVQEAIPEHIAALLNHGIPVYDFTFYANAIFKFLTPHGAFGLNHAMRTVFSNVTGFIALALPGWVSSGYLAAMREHALANDKEFFILDVMPSLLTEPDFDAPEVAPADGELIDSFEDWLNTPPYEGPTPDNAGEERDGE